jgi:flagellar motor switch protein FliN
MASPITAEALTGALAGTLPPAWSSRVGGTASLAAAAAAPAAAGWIVTVAVHGSVAGRVAVWFERGMAARAATVALRLEREPAENAVMDLLRDITIEAAGEVGRQPSATGIAFGETTVIASPPPAGAAFHTLTSDAATGTIAVIAELGSVAAAVWGRDHRLEAVLDVELPLIVRFGRAVMVLRSLAELGPGSVIDMARSPDDPVELLVGDRLIARGEVVIVGGNYGVRVTELAGRRKEDLEDRV